MSIILSRFVNRLEHSGETVIGTTWAWVWWWSRSGCARRRLAGVQAMKVTLTFHCWGTREGSTPSLHMGVSPGATNPTRTDFVKYCKYLVSCRFSYVHFFVAVFCGWRRFDRLGEYCTQAYGNPFIACPLPSADTPVRVCLVGCVVHQASEFYRLLEMKTAIPLPNKIHEEIRDQLTFWLFDFRADRRWRREMAGAEEVHCELFKTTRGRQAGREERTDADENTNCC